MSPATRAWGSNGHGHPHSPSQCSASEAASAIRPSTTAPHTHGTRRRGRSAKALIPFLPTVMSGEEAWAADHTIRRSIEIHAGVAQNPKILSFQSRSSSFPHAKRDDGRTQQMRPSQRTTRSAETAPTFAQGGPFWPSGRTLALTQRTPCPRRAPAPARPIWSVCGSGSSRLLTYPGGGCQGWAGRGFGGGVRGGVACSGVARGRPGLLRSTTLGLVPGPATRCLMG